MINSTPTQNPDTQAPDGLDFSAKVLCDSTSEGRNRCTTMELTYPRCVHSEFMTHRSHARNAASSRAIPIEKMVRDVMEHPFVPMHWGANQKGMQAHSVLDGEDAAQCKAHWKGLRLDAIETVQSLNGLGLHKQIANRLLEPWMWITVITTATERGWANFFRLRCHEMAEPHIRHIAEMTRDAMEVSVPTRLEEGQWHLPLVGFDGDSGLSQEDLIKVAVGRCARVSYLTHAGERDVQADIKLHDFLLTNGHWSPFEHCAQATGSLVEPHQGGNLGAGWKQYRKTFPGEFASSVSSE